jgi:outer membrane protein
VPKQLSLDDCYELALKNNPEILLAKSQIPSNDAAITAAFGTFLPSVNYNLGYNRQLNSSSAYNIGGQTVFLPIGNPNSFNMGINASYVLFNGFEREANFSKAKTLLESNDLNNNFTTKKVINEVYSRYMEVVRNIQIINLRKESIELSKKDLDKSKAQFEAGVIPNTMIYTQEAEIGNKELELINAENSYKISKSNLITVLGLSPEQNVEFLESSIPSTITENDIQKYHNDLGNFNSLLQTALSKRLDYTSLKLSAQSKEYEIDIAKSNYFPTVSASGGWNWSNNEFNQFSDLGRSYVGLSLSVPIFDNFNTNYQIENAKYQVSQSKIQLFQLEQSIKSTLQNALLNLEAAEKQIEIAKRTAFASEKSYESTKERFNGGVATVSDYFLATNQKINSQINILTAVYNYYSAKKQLNFIIGE